MAKTASGDLYLSAQVTGLPLSPPPPVPIFTPFRCAIPFPCIIQPLLVDFNFTRDIIEKGIMRFDRSSVSLILSRIRYLALLFFFLIERYALMK